MDLLEIICRVYTDLITAEQFYIVVACRPMKPIAVPISSRFCANTTFYNFCLKPDGTGGHPMESKKLEKPCENATFQALQGVMKPDEETGGVFPTMKPLD